ncbi:MAG: MarR family transcriptional regulator [Nocardioides sp.]
MSSDAGNRIQQAFQAALVNAVLGNERIAREFGLLLTDLQTLHLLVLRPGVRTPKQLSEVSGLPTSTVTRVIDRLEKADYLQRSADPDDRRRTNIELVPEKVAALVSHYEQYGEELGRVNALFSDTELETVARYLEATVDTF